MLLKRPGNHIKIPKQKEGGGKDLKYSKKFMVFGRIFSLFSTLNLPNLH